MRSRPLALLLDHLELEPELTAVHCTPTANRTMSLVINGLHDLDLREGPVERETLKRYLRVCFTLNRDPVAKEETAAFD